MKMKLWKWFSLTISETSPWQYYRKSDPGEIKYNINNQYVSNALDFIT